MCVRIRVWQSMSVVVRRQLSEVSSPPLLWVLEIKHRVFRPCSMSVVSNTGFMGLPWQGWVAGCICELLRILRCSLSPSPPRCCCSFLRVEIGVEITIENQKFLAEVTWPHVYKTKIYPDPKSVFCFIAILLKLFIQVQTQILHVSNALTGSESLELSWGRVFIIAEIGVRDF